MTYKESLTAAMDELARDPRVRFVGYGITHGRAANTLKNVPPAQLVETPVAENLMVGLAIGMSLAGLRPVVFIERYDFILNALDAIVNHLDKIAHLSGGQFHPAVILRVVAGNHTKPLFTGVTHTQDFSPALRAMVGFPLFELKAPEDVKFAYEAAGLRQDGKLHQNIPTSTMLVEFKDLL